MCEDFIHHILIFKFFFWLDAEDFIFELQAVIRCNLPRRPFVLYNIVYFALCYTGEAVAFV